MSRREFTQDQKTQIVARATDAAGTIRCEKCSLAQKTGSYEIDHIIAEGMRPDADKKVKLTIADGQLLGKDCCHRGDGGKTNDDVKKIAKAKRREAKHLGVKRAKGTIPSRPKQKAASTKQSLAPKVLFAQIGELWPAGNSRTGD